MPAINPIKKAQNQESTKADELSENNVKKQREKETYHIPSSCIKTYIEGKFFDKVIISYSNLPM